MPLPHQLSKVAKITGQRGGEVMTSCERLFGARRKKSRSEEDRGLDHIMVSDLEAVITMFAPGG